MNLWLDPVVSPKNNVPGHQLNLQWLDPVVSHLHDEVKGTNEWFTGIVLDCIKVRTTFTNGSVTQNINKVSSNLTRIDISHDHTPIKCDL